MSVPAALVLLLGAYLGNPDNSSAANEATFEAAFFRLLVHRRGTSRPPRLVRGLLSTNILVAE